MRIRNLDAVMNMPLLINVFGVLFFGVLLFSYSDTDKRFFFAFLVLMLMLNMVALGLRSWYFFCKRKCLDKKFKEVPPN